MLKCDQERRRERQKRIVGTVCLLAGLVISLPQALRADGPAQAEVTVRPRALEEGAVVADAEGFQLVLEQLMLEKTFEEGNADKRLTDLIGGHRSRKLERARLVYDMHPPHLGRDPRDDPRFEDARDAVFSAWKKIQRERLEEHLGLEAWWDRKRARFRGRSSSEEVEECDSKAEKSWRLRFSPRFSDDSAGVKVRLRDTGSGFLDHLTLRYKYEIDESYPVYSLRFEQRLRYVGLDYSPDTPEFGDRLGLSVRLSW